jgi:hypothetical protein
MFIVSRKETSNPLAMTIATASTHEMARAKMLEEASKIGKIVLGKDIVKDNTTYFLENDKDCLQESKTSVIVTGSDGIIWSDKKEETNTMCIAQWIITKVPRDIVCVELKNLDEIERQEAHFERIKVLYQDKKVMDLKTAYQVSDHIKHLNAEYVDKLYAWANDCKEQFGIKNLLGFIQETKFLNIRKAEEMYLESANEGDFVAMRNLAKIHYHVDSVVMRYWLERARVTNLEYFNNELLHYCWVQDALSLAKPIDCDKYAELYYKNAKLTLALQV